MQITIVIEVTGLQVGAENLFEAVEQAIQPVCDTVEVQTIALSGS